MANAWWEYPRIDNFGQQDPAGPYWKPDTNVQIPGGYPVINLLPGTVTNVQRTDWGQAVVTVRLDSAVNQLATHEFYEHLGSAAVTVGQHLGVGDLIGYNNPAGQVPLGYGFYSGDVYGSGPAWGVLQADLAPSGAGLLNPVNVINAVQNGFGPNPEGLKVQSTFGTASGSGGLIDFSWLTNSPIWQWLSDPARLLKMVAGLMVLGLSLYVLVSENGGSMVSKVIPAMTGGKK